MNNKRKTQLPDRRIDLEGAMLELRRMRDAGEWEWDTLDRLSPQARAAFEVMMIEALTSWPPDARRKLRAALIVQGYDEQCARRVMSENIPDSIRASSLYAILRPRGDTGPLTFPSQFA
jgi:hypothetical protein